MAFLGQPFHWDLTRIHEANQLQIAKQSLPKYRPTVSNFHKNYIENSKLESKVTLQLTKLFDDDDDDDDAVSRQFHTISNGRLL
jgi:hypothetical protein